MSTYLDRLSILSANAAQARSPGGARKVAVLGAGAWGTALAIALARRGLDVSLWAWRSAHADAMSEAGENSERLPGCAFPQNLGATASMRDAVEKADVVLLAAPSSATEALAQEAAKYARPGAAALICAKGLAEDGGLLSRRVEAAWKLGPTLVLSGPSFADEVAMDLPTIVTLAGPHAGALAAHLSSPNFVVCPSDDIIGAQIAGVFKNVAAILCGAADGLGCGANARAALMSEAMREAGALVEALGGEAETLLGPAGFGDFALTCTDEKSRNYSLGKRLAAKQGGQQGGKTQEGAANVNALVALAEAAKADAPLAAAVADLVAGRIDAREAVEAAFSQRHKSAKAQAHAA